MIKNIIILKTFPYKRTTQAKQRGVKKGKKKEKKKKPSDKI